jgi:hypothetical protein
VSSADAPRRVLVDAVACRALQRAERRDDLAAGALGTPTPRRRPPSGAADVSTTTRPCGCELDLGACLWAKRGVLLRASCPGMRRGRGNRRETRDRASGQGQRAARSADLLPCTARSICCARALLCSARSRRSGRGAACGTAAAVARQTAARAEPLHAALRGRLLLRRASSAGLGHRRRRSGAAVLRWHRRASAAAWPAAARRRL